MRTEMALADGECSVLAGCVAVQLEQTWAHGPPPVARCAASTLAGYSRSPILHSMSHSPPSLARPRPLKPELKFRRFPVVDRNLQLPDGRRHSDAM